MSILKKIQALLLVIVFAAGCTVIVYDSPVRRARSLYAQHWGYCPYGSFWGHIYWQYQWYYRYPYYSQILSPGDSAKVRRAISKKQLKKPTSSGEITTSSGGTITKVTKRKVVKSEKEKSKKVIKKKKDV